VTYETINSGGTVMHQLKNKFVIIIFSGLVLAGAGAIGYQFSQKGEVKGTKKDQKIAENESLQNSSRDAESMVISAEMNPILENIKAAEEAVALVPKSKEKQELLDRVFIVKEKFNRNLKEKEEAHITELRGKIDQAKIDLGIANSPTEKEFLEIFHKMTHQKVRSEEKWGFIQMSEVNLLAVKEVLQDNPDFNKNIGMLTIVNNWLKNDFSGIVAEHNQIWKLREGTVGKAYGILSPAEEDELVKEQFSR
jgi:hypothetical protein